MNLGRRRIRNEELCACFERLGFAAVSAFLASGNVLFDARGSTSRELEKRIRDGLREQLHYEVPTFVRSAKQLASVAAHQPFAAPETRRLRGKMQVAFLSHEPRPAERTAALALATEEDAIAVVAQEMYWLPSGGLSQSDLDLKSLAACLGPMTIRTQRTVARLVQKLGGES